jgi:DNA polymerase
MPVKDVPTATAWVPAVLSLPKLVAASKNCEGCDLFRHATQTVFGEGPARARVMMVGEQPGDREDLQGKPFVGPAGRLLDKALMEAGVDRSQIYVTNAVKHFKFEERGKRRIHAKPNAIEIAACHPWLEAEATLLRPELIVCLGATAAQALMGRDFRITKERGKILEHPWSRALLATVHPSALLRAPDARRHEEYAEFVRDLRQIVDVVTAVRLVNETQGRAR